METMSQIANQSLLPAELSAEVISGAFRVDFTSPIFLSEDIKFLPQSAMFILFSNTRNVKWYITWSKQDLSNDFKKWLADVEWEVEEFCFSVRNVAQLRY